MRTLMLLLLLAIALPAAPQQKAAVNQLRNNPSPYLALHGGDPTAWQEWNAETVARARREGKLLLLSIGYFSCHWCHVMQRESFRNPQVAAALNRHFIPVKVDRELNGALDAEMQDFATATRGQPGWPQTQEMQDSTRRCANAWSAFSCRLASPARPAHASVATRDSPRGRS